MAHTGWGSVVTGGQNTVFPHNQRSHLASQTSRAAGYYTGYRWEYLRGPV